MLDYTFPTLPYVDVHNPTSDQAAFAGVLAGSSCTGKAVRQHSWPDNSAGKIPQGQNPAAAVPGMMGRTGYTLFCAHSTNSSKLMSLHKARIPDCQMPVLTWSLGGQQCTQLDAITGIMQRLLEVNSSPVSIFVQKLHSLSNLSSVQIVSFLLPTTTQPHRAQVPQLKQPLTHPRQKGKLQHSSGGIFNEQRWHSWMCGAVLKRVVAPGMLHSGQQGN